MKRLKLLIIIVFILISGCKLSDKDEAEIRHTLIQSSGSGDENASIRSIFEKFWNTSRRTAGNSFIITGRSGINGSYNNLVIHIPGHWGSPVNTNQQFFKAKSLDLIEDFLNNPEKDIIYPEGIEYQPSKIDWEGPDGKEPMKGSFWLKSFSIPSPLHLVIIYDRSGSIQSDASGHENLVKIYQQWQNFILSNNLTGSTFKVYLIGRSYNDVKEIFSSNFLINDLETIKDLNLKNDFLGQLDINSDKNASAILEAIKHAYDCINELNGNKCLIVLSDGLEVGDYNFEKNLPCKNDFIHYAKKKFPMDLTSYSVYMAGFDNTYFSNATNVPARFEDLKQIWQELFIQNGAKDAQVLMSSSYF